MKQMQKFIIPIFILNPFQGYKVNIFNKYDLVDSSFQLNQDENFHSDSNSCMRAILVNINHISEDQSLNDEDDINNYQENDTHLISGIQDNLFPKSGSSYSERRDARGSSSSKKKSTLIFRQETKSSHSKEKSHTGASDPTHPENLENFEKAGIPIDPMKDSRRKPDDYNSWQWSKNEKKWILRGEHKVKLSNGKVITEKEWQRILMDNSGKI